MRSNDPYSSFSTFFENEVLNNSSIIKALNLRFGRWMQ